MKITATRLLISAGLLLLVVGCTEDLVPPATPDVPVFLPANAAQPIHLVEEVGDTSEVRLSRTVPIDFSWETDRATTNVLYFGFRADSLRDSISAPVVPLEGRYLYAAGPKRFPVATAIFFHARAQGANGLSSFTPVSRFVTVDPGP